MIGLESFTDDVNNTNYVIRWWVSQSRYRLHRVKCRGSMQDFQNDVWCSLLQTFRDGKRLDYTLATVLTNHCRWVLFRISGTEQSMKRKREFSERIRLARRVKPCDRYIDNHETIDYAETRELEWRIASLMRTLPFRHAAVLRARFGLFGDTEMTLEQVGEALKLSRERVRQIEIVGINKLREHKRAMFLIPFFDGDDRKDIDEARAKQMQSTEYGAALFEELTKD